MKICSLTLFILAVLVESAVAQDNKHIINAGEDITNAIPASEKFHYPQFTQGTVLFRDGQVSAASLNYNLLVNQMQFIAPAGDTMAVANEATIKYISINRDTFYFDQQYLQLITGNTAAKLAKSERIKVIDINKTGGFGQRTSGAGISTYSTLYTGSQRMSLTENKQLTLLKQTFFYLGNNDNHFLPASKKNLLKLLGKKQSGIEAYLKENNPDFNNEEDLKKLVSFVEKSGN